MLTSSTSAYRAKCWPLDGIGQVVIVIHHVKVGAPRQSWCALQEVLNDESGNKQLGEKNYVCTVVESITERLFAQRQH